MFDKYFEVDDGFICYVVKIKMPSYRSIIGNHIEAFHVSWGFQQVKIILLFIDLVVFIREKKLKSVRRFKKRLYEITMPLYWLAHHQGLSRKMFFVSNMEGNKTIWEIELTTTQSAFPNMYGKENVLRSVIRQLLIAETFNIMVKLWLHVLGW